MNLIWGSDMDDSDSECERDRSQCMKKIYIYIYSSEGEWQITKTTKSLFAKPGRSQLKINANMLLGFRPNICVGIYE